MYLDWEKIAKQREWCAAELWNKLMQKNTEREESKSLTIREICQRMEQRNKQDLEQ